ncbi:MAG TPA: triose-phosphate isomerase, partial [Candidatus Hydrogenedentes bacterium]|nr:triose-phosphate isomerase [Candidatus Hydrogenedentota bacterium]
MRKPIVAGNWKMNNTIRESVALAQGVRELVGSLTSVDVVVCPTYVSLHAVAEAVKGSNIAVGAQDAYVKDSGAYTGEISPRMILDAGAAWTIIGHSER